MVAIEDALSRTGSGPVRSFQFFIDDARSGAPRRFAVQARDEHRAREIAERILAESDHHLGVEVCENGTRVFGLGTLSVRTCCGLEPDAESEPAPG